MILGWICYSCKKKYQASRFRNEAPDKCDCGEYMMIRVEDYKHDEKDEKADDADYSYYLDGY